MVASLSPKERTSKVTELTVRPPTEDDFDSLARLQARSAADDNFDPLSTMESLPSAAELRDLASRSSYFCVVESGDDIAGYGSLRWWDEETGPRVILCDWYLAAAFRELDRPLLVHLEDQAFQFDFDDETKERTVIGTNASSVQTNRAEVIEALGYSQTFSMVDMELRGIGELDAPPLPDLELRKVTVDDAENLVDLARRVWSKRDYFAMPTVEKLDSWIRRSDLTLFDVAVSQGEIVALVASIPRGGIAELDDVQVDPRFQRKGVATALIAHNFRALKARGFDVVRLKTEGNDPAGARSLYEKLGFRLVRSYMRYRKPLGGVSELRS